MIARDYILRILQEFFDAIAKAIHKDIPGQEPDLARVQERFNDIYRQFFRRPAEHFYQTSKEDILAELSDEDADSTTAKVQMLSELLYRDALIKSDLHDRCNLLEKALFMLEYLDCNSRTFSWDRGQRIGDIKKMLTEFNTSA